MSKRYGRNQKRRHIHEIERLERALDRAITGGFARARPGDLTLDELVDYFVSIDINDREDGFTIQRTAEVRFAPASRDAVKKIVYHTAYSGFLAWRGIRWIVRMPHLVDPAGAFYDIEVLGFELQALGDRDDRRPIAKPHMPTIDIKRHRRIAA